MFKSISSKLLALAGPNVGTETSGSTVALGFTIPSFDSVLTFLLRFLFIVGGLVAVLYLLLGALAWITSGGNKESVDKAREKIQAAIVGLVVMFAVLAVIVVLESIFSLGLGISQPIKFPKLIN